LGFRFSGWLGDDVVFAEHDIKWEGFIGVIGLSNASTGSSTFFELTGIIWG